MNTLIALRAHLYSLRTAVFSRAGTIETLRADARTLKATGLLIAHRNNERANVLENQMAAIEAQIEALDIEVDEANLIAIGAARLCGE